MGRGLCTAQITLIIYYQIKLDKLNICETFTCSISKMCWWLSLPYATLFIAPFLRIGTTVSTLRDIYVMKLSASEEASESSVCHIAIAPLITAPACLNSKKLSNKYYGSACMHTHLSYYV
jgi:hypothetical protein